MDEKHDMNGSGGPTCDVVTPKIAQTELQILKQKLEQDLGQAQGKLRTILQQLETLHKNEQFLVTQKIAFETLVNYLSVTLNK